MNTSVTAGRRARAAILVLAAALLAGCGLKDDLYLPESPQPAGETAGDEEDSDDGTTA